MVGLVRSVVTDGKYLYFNNYFDSSLYKMSISLEILEKIDLEPTCIGFWNLIYNNGIVYCCFLHNGIVFAYNTIDHSVRYYNSNIDNKADYLNTVLSKDEILFIPSTFEDGVVSFNVESGLLSENSFWTGVLRDNELKALISTSYDNTVIYISEKNEMVLLDIDNKIIKIFLEEQGRKIKDVTYDGNYLYYILDNGGENIYRISVETGAKEQISGTGNSNYRRLVLTPNALFADAGDHIDEFENGKLLSSIIEFDSDIVGSNFFTAISVSRKTFLFPWMRKDKLVVLDKGEIQHNSFWELMIKNKNERLLYEKEHGLKDYLRAITY